MAIASAWLIDNSIADKIIVTWLSRYNHGIMGFNGWAAYIVLEKLRLVQFIAQSKPFSHVPRNRLYELAELEARDYMLILDPDYIALKGDADGPPAISIMRPDYIKKTKWVSFGGWTIFDGHEVPSFKDDPDSQAIVVTEVNQKVITDEWWRAMKNPAAWHTQLR